MKAGKRMATQTSAAAEGPTRGTGLRERRKNEKLDAIKRAARQLFATHGFHMTPMREIARVADVGFGTVAAYASDKAGLAAMLFVDDLTHLPPLFVAPIKPDRPVLDQLMDDFSVSFQFWASKPELSQIVLPMLNTSGNPHVQTIMERRAHLRQCLIQWLDRAKELRRMKSDFDSEQAAELFFSLYIHSLHEWLSADLADHTLGLDRLRYLLEIPVRQLEL
ncbi:TetR/AcrR family transcriptional regulator [Povalibacter sp.]|uniref:TetR/AcrR family transcriptional regulator n=1 Tax=Povalibacter sp. TaxID=1962978 RepID=UPI002D1FB220|nr:TetR/AcrR family transcriptional regulator [Povalibacter sp.]